MQYMYVVFVELKYTHMHEAMYNTCILCVSSCDVHVYEIHQTSIHISYSLALIHMHEDTMYTLLHTINVREAAMYAYEATMYTLLHTINVREAAMYAYEATMYTCVSGYVRYMCVCASSYDVDMCMRLRVCGCQATI